MLSTLHINEPGDVPSVEILSLDRPQKRNAMLPRMLKLLQQHVERSQADAIVLTGNGPTFCAGFDLDACEDDPAVLDDLLSMLSQAIEAMVAAPQPVVMAVQGAAIAGGCALVGGASYVLGVDDVRFGYPVLAIGVSPAVSAPTLAHRSGWACARELLLNPELISAHKALKLGLLNEVVPSSDSLVDRATGVARSLARPSPDARQHTAAWLHEIAQLDLQQPAGLNASRSVVNTDEQRDMLSAAVIARRNKQS